MTELELAIYHESQAELGLRLLSPEQHAILRVAAKVAARMLIEQQQRMTERIIAESRGAGMQYGGDR